MENTRRAPSCQPEADKHSNPVSLPPVELGTILDAKTKEIEAAGFGHWSYNRPSYAIEEVIKDVIIQRTIQDLKWGGPPHDDTHTWGDWTLYIAKFSDRGANAISHPDFEQQMVHVAALAVAAIQSSRRKVAGRSGKSSCTCANPGVDLTTGVCDCVEPVRSGSIYCPCHGKVVDSPRIPEGS